MGTRETSSESGEDDKKAPIPIFKELRELLVNEEGEEFVRDVENMKIGTKQKSTELVSTKTGRQFLRKDGKTIYYRSRQKDRTYDEAWGNVSDGNEVFMHVEIMNEKTKKYEKKLLEVEGFTVGGKKSTSISPRLESTMSTIQKERDTR